MGHFYMENICTMDEQRKCELKIIAGKIGWILLIAYLGSLILMRIMPIFAENVSFPMQPIMSPRQIPMRLPIKFVTRIAR